MFVITYNQYPSASQPIEVRTYGSYGERMQERNHAYGERTQELWREDTGSAYGESTREPTL